MLLAFRYNLDNLEKGTYVCYIDSDFTDKWAERKLLSYNGDGLWHYPMSDQRFRGHIYDVIGPLPVMELGD